MSSKRKERGVSSSPTLTTALVVDGDALFLALNESLTASYVLPKKSGANAAFIDLMRTSIAAQLQSALQGGIGNEGAGAGGGGGAGAAPEPLDRSLATEVARLDSQATALGREVKVAREKVSLSRDCIITTNFSVSLF